jgi:hypothetical protein
VTKVAIVSPFLFHIVSYRRIIASTEDEYQVQYRKYVKETNRVLTTHSVNRMYEKVQILPNNDMMNFC